MRAILFSVLTLLLCACNSDIFVEDFAPDVTEITMDGEHSTRTIHFRSDDWSSLTVAGTDRPMIVTPAGGEPFSGKTLVGDGTLAFHSEFTDLVVTRRGADVTIDINYAIGKDALYLWLEAASEEVFMRHEILVCVNRVDGLEITDVDYVLDMWGTEPAEAYALGALGLNAEAPGPIAWQPELKSGMLTFYDMSAPENEELLAALVGAKIEVPSCSGLVWRNWQLRGDEAVIMTSKSVTRLQHYPKLPETTVDPGTKVTLWVEMEPCIFHANVKVRNRFSGVEHEMLLFVRIGHPAVYKFISNEI